jgi:hypothetical protein
MPDCFALLAGPLEITKPQIGREKSMLRLKGLFPLPARSGHYRQPASRRLLPPLADMWRSKLIIARGMRGAATMRVLAVG